MTTDELRKEVRELEQQKLDLEIKLLTLEPQKNYITKTLELINNQLTDYYKRLEKVKEIIKRHEES